MADPTRLELATSAVTGQRSNQLSYESSFFIISYFGKKRKAANFSLPSPSDFWRYGARNLGKKENLHFRLDALHLGETKVPFLHSRG